MSGNDQATVNRSFDAAHVGSTQNLRTGQFFDGVKFENLSN